MIVPHEYKQALLKIDKVSLSYGDQEILRDVHAEVREIDFSGDQHGQVVGFLGPSGVGKTSLFRIIAGLKKPTSGEVLIADKHIAGQYHDAAPGDVGVVAQNYPLFASRTVLSNLRLAATSGDKDAKVAEDLVIEYLQHFDLVDVRDRYPAQLSGGQRQRVAILQQVLSDSRFILMDEPFSGLDMLMLEKTCKTISAVAARSRNTIIVVTHDITAAASISDHIWLLGRERDKNGHIIPGARVVETYDLLERGLCYEDGMLTKPEFLATVAEIKNRFRSL